MCVRTCRPYLAVFVLGRLVVLWRVQWAVFFLSVSLPFHLMFLTDCSVTLCRTSRPYQPARRVRQMET